jgi:hypothetical protein
LAPAFERGAGITKESRDGAASIELIVKHQEHFRVAGSTTTKVGKTRI